MFQCYLDDSATSGLPVVTMAGFIAHLDKWERIEPALDSLMDGYGVSVFHAKEFHDTKPPFRGWGKIKKRTFADEVFTISHGLIYGLSFTIRKADFKRAQQDDKGIQPMSPIGVCFSAIMSRIVTDPEIGPAVKKEGVSFLIESGNKNNSGIEQFFHQMQRHPTFEGSLRGISMVPKGSCRAIQLADFFAFHSRRQMRNHDRFSGRLALPACPFIEILRKHGPIWQHGGYGLPNVVGRLRDLPDLDGLTELTQRRPS